MPVRYGSTKKIKTYVDEKLAEFTPPATDGSDISLVENADFSALETRVRANEVDITALESNDTEQDNLLASHQSSLVGIGVRLGNAEDDIEAVELRVTATENDIEAIQLQMEQPSVGIDDMVIGTTTTWSSSKITNELSGKASTTDVSLKADAETTQTALANKSDISHTHTDLSFLNREVLLGLSVDGLGNLLFNGQPIASGGVSEGGSGVPQLVEVHETIVSVLAGGSSFVSFPIGFSKYDVRTIWAKATNGNEISLALYDNESGFKVYESLVETEVYDILNIPIEDKSATESLHVLVMNKGVSTADIEFIVKATNLL